MSTTSTVVKRSQIVVSARDDHHSGTIGSRVHRHWEEARTAAQRRRFHEERMHHTPPPPAFFRSKTSEYGQRDARKTITFVGNIKDGKAKTTFKVEKNGNPNKVVQLRRDNEGRRFRLRERTESMAESERRCVLERVASEALAWSCFLEAFRKAG